MFYFKLCDALKYIECKSTHQKIKQELSYYPNITGLFIILMDNELLFITVNDKFSPDIIKAPILASVFRFLKFKCKVFNTYYYSKMLNMQNSYIRIFFRQDSSTDSEAEDVLVRHRPRRSQQQEAT